MAGVNWGGIANSGFDAFGNFQVPRRLGGADQQDDSAARTRRRGQGAA